MTSFPSKKISRSIIYVISNPPGWDGSKSVGGGEVRAMEMLKWWETWGEKIEILETEYSPSRDLGTKFEVHAVSCPIRICELFTSVYMTMALLLEAYRLGIDKNRDIKAIIAATSNFSDVGPAWLISKLSKKPFFVVFQVLCYSHSLPTTFALMKKDGGGVFNALRRTLSGTGMLKLAREASAIFCISRPVAEMVQKLGFPENRVYITNSGVDLKRINTIASEKQDCDAIYLGRVEMGKGIKELLYMWGIVVKERPDAKLLIIGSGSFMKNAKLMAKRLNIQKNLEFKGWISSDAKYSYLKRSKIFVFPSRSEGFGLVVLEALACGLPVVCFENIGENFPDCGSLILIPPGDVKTFGKAILMLLKDDALLERYKTISEEYARQYSWGYIAKNELKIIKSILQKEGISEV